MSFALQLSTSLGLGLAATLNPCVLPLYPGFLAYLAGEAKQESGGRFHLYAGLLVLGGVLIFMSAVGLITAVFGLSISGFIGTVSPIAFALLIVIGILLLADVDISRFVPRFSTPALSSPYMSAFVFGLMYGPIVIPCNGPLVFSVFAYSVTAASFAQTYTLFLVFGMGFGIPLILISLLSQARGQLLIRSLLKYHTAINRLAGTLLVGFGLYELLVVFRVQDYLF